MPVDKETRQTVQGMKAIMRGSVNRIREYVANLDHRLQAVEKKVGIPTPAEKQSRVKEDDSNVDLDKRIVSGRNRIDSLEEDVEQIKSWIRGQI